jgi:hypothetical protein
VKLKFRLKESFNALSKPFGLLFWFVSKILKKITAFSPKQRFWGFFIKKWLKIRCCDIMTVVLSFFYQKNKLDGE